MHWGQALRYNRFDDKEQLRADLGLLSAKHNELSNGHSSFYLLAEALVGSAVQRSQGSVEAA